MIGLRSACPASRPETPDCHDPLAEIAELLALELNGGEGPIDFSHEATNVIVSPVDRGFLPEHHLVQRVPLYGRIDLVQEHVNTSRQLYAAIARLKTSTSSRDIAYSSGPAASRTSPSLPKFRHHVALPSRNLIACHNTSSKGTPPSTP